MSRSKILSAFSIACDVHAEQTDQAGQPYIHHCIAVANGVLDEDDTTIAAAILHDAIEDAAKPGATALRIKREVGGDVLSIVKALTHRTGEPYSDYIARVAQIPAAATIKNADLAHNMDLGRLAKITAADLARQAKYRAAVAQLHAVAAS